MEEYFTEQANLFSRAGGSEIKPESEISSHITLTECTSVISGLFHTRYLAEVVSRYVTLGVN